MPLSKSDVSLASDEIPALVRTAFNSKMRQVVRILSDKLTVKVTARHRHDRRASRVEYVVTIGAPAYAEADLIKRAKKRKDPLPRVTMKFERPKK